MGVQNALSMAVLTTPLVFGIILFRVLDFGACLTFAQSFCKDFFGLKHLFIEFWHFGRVCYKKGGATFAGELTARSRNPLVSLNVGIQHDTTARTGS